MRRLKSASVPLIADMSSTILSRPVDVRKFGVIYAGAQKNIGPSGLVILIVRKDLLERAPAGLPAILKYSSHAAAGSMLNTPPTFGWYIAGLVFAWLKRQGGLEKMAEINRRKAELLYQAIDAFRLLQQSGGQAVPLVDECDVHAGRCGAGCGFSQRRPRRPG